MTLACPARPPACLASLLFMVCGSVRGLQTRPLVYKLVTKAANGLRGYFRVNKNS